MATATVPATVETARQRGRSLSTMTINAAFLLEIKQVNEDLWLLLRELRFYCGRPQLLRIHLRHTVELLNQLQDELAMHFTMEEYYGYFEEPMSVAPHLSMRVKELRDEHSVLFKSICRITELAERFLYAGKLARLAKHITVGFRSFDDQLKAHEASEQELMLEAFDEDIGVGD